MDANTQTGLEKEDRGFFVTGNYDVGVSLLLIWLPAVILGFIAWITSKNAIAGIVTAIFTAMVMDGLVGRFGHSGSTQPTLFWRFLAKTSRLAIVLAFCYASGLLYGPIERKLVEATGQMTGIWLAIAMLGIYILFGLYLLICIFYSLRAYIFCSDPMLPEGAKKERGNNK